MTTLADEIKRSKAESIERARADAVHAAHFASVEARAEEERKRAEEFARQYAAAGL